MRSLLVFSIFLAVIVTASGCDSGHGHSHDDPTPANPHKSID